MIALRVTLSNFKWLQRKAGDKKVPTYLAETVEQQAANARKSSFGGVVNRQAVRAMVKMKKSDKVSPNFKNGGKK